MGCALRSVYDKSQIIYFTDTGLVCSLLGIRKQEELDYHFLKGNIFGTFVVSEFIKGCYNTGEKFELYYWRDNHKKEIDLIIDFGINKLGLEIKRSETIQEKYFSGLSYWKNLSNTDSKNMYLIYGGTDNFVRLFALTSVERKDPVNSVFEEVYWRGYIFKKLEDLVTPVKVLILTSLQ